MISRLSPRSIILSRAKSFGANRSAVAAMEFALVLPMLLAAGLGGGEVMRYLLIQKQVGKAAETVAMMVAALDTPFKGTDESFIFDAMQIVVPFAQRDATDRSVAWRNVINVGMGVVRFDKVNPACVSDCDTLPTTVWRTALRSCGALPFTANGDFGSVPSALQRSLGSLVVADVSYTYQSWFGTRFVPPMTITRSSFQQPRYVDMITSAGPLSWNCV
jgi:Flp pilus assembly protein TadG